MIKERFKKWSKDSLYFEGRIPSELSDTEETLTIENKDEYYSCGYFSSCINTVEKGKLYTFSIDIRQDTIDGKAYAVVFQLDKNGYELAGDYLTKKEEDDDKYTLSLELCEECEIIKMELMFYSFGAGRADFSYPEVIIEDKKPHRIVNLATAYFSRKWYTSCEENFNQVLEIIDNAAKDENKPDILCFTETTYDRGVKLPMSKKFIQSESEAVKAVAEKAKEYGMYIIFGFHEEEEGCFYNTSALISDKGEIIGNVRKTHLCYGEIKAKMIPGRELPVFELPFGKIGILICWDQWFPEATRTLVKKGAEIIFVTTAGNPECISKARAYENGVFVVVSGCSDNLPQSSFIVNEEGEVIAAVESEEKGYVSIPVDLDAHRYTRYLSFENGYGRNLYRLDRRDDLYIKETED